ncbi:MAG TPA: peptidoglycan DD-metalloendopeptidase family protein [Nocardioidaceae bacterium]|nr:peptidoglycan DD-metalloendopeptidase family protein [Nocardioidaceae bacterium]
MPLRRTTPVLAALAVAAGLIASPSAAVALPDHELPFTCAEQWTATTRANHSPSRFAVDFNRDRDLGRLVVASASGVVSRVEDTGTRGYGKWIRIEHSDGHATVYAHLKAQWVVPGQFVDQGTPIGRVGDSGSASGAHLHYEQRSGRDVQPALFHEAAVLHSTPTPSLNCPDVPLAGDWDGDRVAEPAVFRRLAGAGAFEMYDPQGAVPVPVRLGRASDLPVTGDWDGDGVTDVGVRRQATRVFFLRGADGVVTRKRFGRIKDLPVTGDWDGNGTTDLGVWRPGAVRFRLLREDGTQQVVRLGNPGSQPVTGDWDGDGTTDVGVFEPVSAAFLLRTVAADGVATVTPVPLGFGSDLPVTGDWNGDGITDVGTWTPGTATYTLRVTPSPSSARRSGTAEPKLRTIVFGRPR